MRMTDRVVDDIARRTIKWVKGLGPNQNVDWGDWESTENGDALWSQRFMLADWCKEFRQSEYMWRRYIEPRLCELGSPAVTENGRIGGTRLGPDFAGGYAASKRAGMAESLGKNAGERCIDRLDGTPFFAKALAEIRNGDSVVRLVRGMARRTLPRSTETLLLTDGRVELNPSALAMLPSGD